MRSESVTTAEPSKKAKKLAGRMGFAPSTASLSTEHLEPSRPGIKRIVDQSKKIKLKRAAPKGSPTFLRPDRLLDLFEVYVGHVVIGLARSGTVPGTARITTVLLRLVHLFRSVFPRFVNLLHRGINSADFLA